MEVINPRSALLSNFEVLALLHDLEHDHLERTKTALRVKKEEDMPGNPNTSLSSGGKDLSVAEDICENLRTIEVETIQYLSAEYQPTSSQSSSRVTKLIRDISPFDLTKTEKLQIVNLAPTEAVELYVIVEELEDRLGDRMEEVLTHVRESVKTPDPFSLVSRDRPEARQLDTQTGYTNVVEPWDAFLDVDGEGDVEFDDTGEGVGVDGDLDINDD